MTIGSGIKSLRLCAPWMANAAPQLSHLRPVSSASFLQIPKTAPENSPRTNQVGLDGAWERRINRGGIAIDMTVDLHGETLATAHARLNASLARAVRDGARAILLITGRPPKAPSRGGQGGRGVIRASILDWLAASPYRGHIAAIRNAHPRHGGEGALYLIMRRPRPKS